MKAQLWHRIVLIVVLLMMIGQWNCPPAVQGSAPVPQAPNPPTDAYQYPIHPGMTEWKELKSHAEMLKALTIPDEILKKMSTAGLVETVLNYPLLTIDSHAFNTPQDGFDSVSQHFNGLAELLKRPDAGAELLAQYRAINFSASPKALSAEALNVAFQRRLNLEMLLAQKPFLSQLTAAQQDELVQASYQAVTAEAQQPEVYGSLSQNSTYWVLGRTLQQGTAPSDAQKAPAKALNDFLSDGLLRSGDTLSLIAEQAKARLGKTATPSASSQSPAPYGSLYVYTPRGTPVIGILSTEMSPYEIQSANQMAAIQYPRAIRMSDASARYNCHSFAWYYTNTANTVWINDPSYYWRDRSWTYIVRARAFSGIPAGLPNSTRVYYDAGDNAHSAVKYTETTFISKWGQWPVMVHTPAYSPYSDDNPYLNYYYR